MTSSLLGVHGVASETRRPLFRNGDAAVPCSTTHGVPHIDVTSLQVIGGVDDSHMVVPCNNGLQ